MNEKEKSENKAKKIREKRSFIPYIFSNAKFQIQKAKPLEAENRKRQGNSNTNQETEPPPPNETTPPKHGVMNLTVLVPILDLDLVKKTGEAIMGCTTYVRQFSTILW